MGGIFHRAEFRLQVITPLFMYGVGDEAELRTQSFKGMMRGWWRAVRAEGDTGRLFEEEGDIFGYADRGASKVWLEVFPPRNYRRSMEVSVEVESTENEKKSKIYKYSVNIGEIGGEVGLTWESEKKRLRGEHYGIAYLLYSILMLSGGRVSYVPPGTEFKLVLKSMDGDALKIAVASLWCAVWLGGFGRRSRRGGGNLAFLSAEGTPTGVLDFVFKDGDFTGWLGDNLGRCREIIGVSEGPPPSYSNLSRSRMVISRQTFATWSDALNDVGKRFYDFRIRGNHRSNYVFGLPHKYRPPYLRGFNRRASPLIIKVVKVGGGFRWVLLNLSGSFLPVKTVIHNLIDQFIESVLLYGEEVSL